MAGMEGRGGRGAQAGREHCWHSPTASRSQPLSTVWSILRWGLHPRVSRISCVRFRCRAFVDMAGWGEGAREASLSSKPWRTGAMQE